MTFTTLLGFSEWPTSHQGWTHHQRWPVLLCRRLPGRWTHKVGGPNTPFKEARLLSCPALRGSRRLAFCPRITVLVLVTPRDGDMWGGANHGWKRGWCLLSAPWWHRLPAMVLTQAVRPTEAVRHTHRPFFCSWQVVGPWGQVAAPRCRMS